MTRSDHKSVTASDSPESELLPDATLATLGGHVESRRIDGTGPLPHQEAPDRVVQEIETWLASAVGAR